MILSRLAATVSVLALGLTGALAPSALGAEGIGPAKKLAGGGEATTVTTSASRTNTGSEKETLTIAISTPTNGQTVSGKIAWGVSVLAGAPSKVEFLVDGVGKWSDTSAPYSFGADAGSLDTAKLTNGSHTLSATAYGSKGVKASAKVTVTVANGSPAPEPEPTPEPEPAPEPAPAPQPTGGSIFWGATIGSHLTGNQAPWDMGAVTKFEEGARKKVSMVQFFQPFANCNPGCSFYKFPTSPMESIRNHGSIPVLSWSSQSIPSTKNEPDFQLSDVISGRYDNYIREFATQAKGWNHPFFLRFNWEMNGTWFPWHEGVNGNLPGESAKAWRHVHDIFTAVGVTNATWTWCPNVEYSGSTSLASLYPGDSYVDWTCLDGYNWGTNPAKPDRWKTFNEVYKASYQKIVETIAPSKPMMIGEVASTEYGGSKATWIKDMLTRIPTEYPKIRALLWFDKFDSNMDWPVETTSSATSAFAEGLQSSKYLGNTFSGLSATKVLPQS
ncbi:MAG TPA: Ig-like domain-containing protein [Solirubrobacterales bacterium]|nr:Ig-like domain-containing protein [Solirubrobacterales bacterium]